jgi:hydrogenase maturation protein HypF
MFAKDEPGVSVKLSSAVPTAVIAVGGDLKNTICVAQGGTATVTRAIGSLADVEDYRRFICELNRLVAGVGDRSIVFAHDLHPAYLSTVAARKLASKVRSAQGPEVVRTADPTSSNGAVRTADPTVPCEAVQHHHAHVVACLAEHGVERPVIGIACDGTGYGTDGAGWGCEVLHATPADFERCAHIQYFPLPGGDAAAKQTWRPALGLVYQAFAGDLPAHTRKVFDRVATAEFSAVQAMLAGGFNCPPTSSLGRLFDAVAFLGGVCDFNEYEGQAAIQLEAAAKDGPDRPYAFHMVESDSARQIVVSDMITEICRDVRDGADADVIASRFHATVAQMLSSAALTAGRAHDTDTVALSGGCFLNRILVDRTERLLLEGGAKVVLKHERLSPGDASLSVGQAVAVAARLRGEC